MSPLAKGIAAVVCALAAFLWLGSGCATRGMESGNREVTVLPNPISLTYEKAPASALVRIDDARGSDWLGDDAIVIDRENGDAPSVEAEGITWHPRNLYVRTLDSGKETPLLPDIADKNQGAATVSSDRSLLFFKTYDLQSNTGQGYVLDLATGKSAPFTGKDELELQNGGWTGDRELLYSDLKGTVYKVAVNPDGKPVRTPLLRTRQPFLQNLAFVNNKLYYSTGRGTLYRHDEKSDSAVTAGVVWMSPSPDGTRWAVVQRLKSGNMELIITDMKSTVALAVAQDFQLFGASWSPDGTRIAYSGITENGTVRGVYVADASTGISTELQVDIKFIADRIRWNPSGDRVMIASAIPDENRGMNRFVTYLVKVERG